MENDAARPLEKLLAIETSGRLFSVALAEAGKETVLKGETLLDAGLRHSEVLRDACESLLRGCGWDKRDLTRLAVSTGPGSFTGLRVGIAFARAFAQATGLPLTGATVFEILARGGQAEQQPQAALIDSIGSDLFAGFFAAGSLRPQRAYRVYGLDALIKELARGPRRLLSGPGLVRYEKELRRGLGRKFLAAAPDRRSPRASWLAEIALDRARRAKTEPDAWKEVAPFYLRPPVAVERLDYRKRKTENGPQRKIK